MNSLVHNDFEPIVINNGYYICKSHCSDLKVLSTTYLAKRIGVKPYNTRNGLDNSIISVLCRPFSCRCDAYKYIGEELATSDSSWIDISSTNKLTENVNNIKLTSSYYLYLANEQKFMKIAEEVGLSPIKDLQSIRKSAITATLDVSAKEILSLFIKKIDRRYYKLNKYTLILKGLLSNNWFDRDALVRLKLST